jgi:elongation factor P
VQRQTRSPVRGAPLLAQGSRKLKVIASTLRKGNVVDLDNRLYVVLTAQNFHPGKGTPVTQVDMRRISDGVKVSERWRTTEQVEKATVDDREYDFLYEDGEGFHFMEPQTYDQIAVHPDVVGDGKVYLTEGMRVHLKTFENMAIAIEFPQRVTVEITETEPVVKGQTASSSYKPAMCSNGLRVLVPAHIGAGVRIVINTDDNSYVERAKD